MNDLIGYAFPIFKYNGKVYSNVNKLRKIIDLNDSTTELDIFIDELSRKKTIIFDLVLGDDNILNISYQTLEKLNNN
jgi:hypothetical protein